MNANRKEAYYVGLDMGTGSLGVAVTDKNYNLIKVKGKDYWSVREFDTAKTQLDRRTHRISERGLQRHQARIGMIKCHFSDDILAHDPFFFIRLDNSKYLNCDKDACLKSKDCLFADANYGDKEYYKDYPTIFHLRQALIRDEVYDENRYSRLLYLVLVNMFEHRGHFLLNSSSEDFNSVMVKEAGENIVNYLTENAENSLNDFSCDDFIEILSDKRISRSDKKEKMIECLGVRKTNKPVLEIIKCLCGLDADARVMFTIDADAKIKVFFGSTTYEDEIEDIKAAVGDEYYVVLEQMKQIYDYCQLNSILKGYDYLSDARVDMYVKHKRDLELLKRVYKRDLSREKYDIMFRSNEDATYSAYSNSLNSKDSLAEKTKYRRNMKKRSKYDLYDRIKKDLSGIENEDVKKILKEIEIEQFLPKQLTGANGVIPNQVHLKELKKILQNAEKHLPFLLGKDESGLTVSERIIRLFSFHIPYYIGPVDKNSQTGWVERLEEGTVLPWNMEQKIDVDKTSEKFITNLIRECTYLSGEKVMPKQSLLYESFCVLNEINNLKIRGKRIEPKLKQDIYNDLFMGSKMGKKVTRKTLCGYLVNRGLISDDTEISGIDKEINSYLSSYGKMYAVFGEKLREDSYKKIAEEIIFYGTIFGDSKVMYRKKLNKYLERGLLDETQIKRILGYKFKDWARFSEKLLYLCACDKNTGEEISLIRAMWSYNYNFMELINSEFFTFKEALEGKKKNLEKILCEFEYEDLKDYYYSAPVKRMIWQTILCLKEISEIMGHSPERIFIEMARSDEEKGDRGRKASRENRLLELYKSIKDQRPWANEIKEAGESGTLSSKKLYLYYLQMGRDAYTGEEIPLEHLSDKDKYDIDHIYPRSLTNDNSLENNLVLVSKKINEDDKKDDYPLPAKVRNNAKVRELWNTLHKMGFMNDEKYNRLTSNEPLTEEQLAGFIARQLVETRQGTKVVAELIESLMPGTKVVYVKAQNVSDFRRDFGIIKSRLVNDFHHAQDAYLNIVVGNVYFTKFTMNPYNFIKCDKKKDGKKRSYNLYKMYQNDVARNGEVAWIAPTEDTPGTIQLVKNTVCRNTAIITRHVTVQKGELFNLQPKSHYVAKNENYVPLKASDEKMKDVTKYGGYTSLNPAYFIFIEHGSDQKRKRCFEVVHAYYASKIRSKQDLVEYLEKQGYVNPLVIADKIRKNTLIKYNGYFLYIIGMDSRKNVEFANATAMCLNNQFVQYIHKLEKANLAIQEDIKKKKTPIIEKEITAEKNLELFLELKEKHTNAIFANHPRSIGSVLENGENSFKLLGVEQQINVLCNILQYTSFGKGVFSLSEIGGPKEVGRIRISGNMTDAKELKIVNYSVTGIFKCETNLLNS